MTGPTETSPTDQRRETRPPGLDGRQIAIGAAAAILVLAVAGLTLGASRLFAPGMTPVRGDPGSEWQGPRSGMQPDRGARGWRTRGLRTFGLEGPGAFRMQNTPSLGRPALTISAIEGTGVTLTTADGWTRTVSVTDATTITKAGATIMLADLRVGDALRIRQTRNDDGSYTITAIQVILPVVAGQVTATSADTITLQARDGSTVTVHVGSETTYQVRGVASPTLSDVSAGMLLVAQGTQNDDGSLQAVAVYAAAKR